MLKFCETSVVFQELPNEITLYITISNCPYNCNGCNSSYLQKDIGKKLDVEVLSELLIENDGITAVLFGGGDAEPEEINKLAFYIKNNWNLKVGWYSGKSTISKYISIENFDYIKIGPWIKELGGLKNIQTNQKIFKVEDNLLKQIYLWERN